MISFGLYTTNYTTIYYYDMYEPAGLAGVTCSLCLSLFLLFFFSSSSSIPPSPPSHYCRRPTCLPSKLLIHPLLSIVYIYLLFGCFCLKLTLSPVALQFIIPTFQRIQCHPLPMSADLTKVDSAVAGLSTSPQDEKAPISELNPTHRRKSSVAEGVWNIKDLGRVHTLSSWDGC